MYHKIQWPHIIKVVWDDFFGNYDLIVKNLHLIIYWPFKLIHFFILLFIRHKIYRIWLKFEIVTDPPRTLSFLDYSDNYFLQIFFILFERKKNYILASTITYWSIFLSRSWFQFHTNWLLLCINFFVTPPNLGEVHTDVMSIQYACLNLLTTYVSTQIRCLLN